MRRASTRRPAAMRTWPRLRLADIVRGRISRAAVASQPLAQVVADARGALSESGIRRDRAPRHGNSGVELVDVQLQRIDLTDDAATAVYQRMQQSHDRAGAAAARAGGMAEAEKIRADADRKRAADPGRRDPRIAAHARRGRCARGSRSTPGRTRAIPNLAAFYRSLQAYKNTLGRDGRYRGGHPEGEFFKYLHSASGR